MRTFLLPLALAGALTAGPAAAQTSARFNLPPDRGLIMGSISATGPSFFQMNPAQSGSSIAVDVLHRFPADLRQLRFESETGWLELPIFVRPSQAEEPAKLRIRYMNSVAVMPEGSKLSVFINDAPVLEANIEAAAEPGLIEIPVPAGLLEAGYNSLRFAVNQRHRVDCTIQATNELWTQIDAAASGIVFTTANDQVTRIDDLIGMPAEEGGATFISVNLAPGSDTAAMDRALRAAQAVAVRLGVRKPRVAFSRELLTAPGIQLIVGTATELRSRGIEVNPFGDSGVGVSGNIGGTVRVVVSGATAADIDESIEKLAKDRHPDAERGTRPGIRALTVQRGFPLNSEGAVSLRDIGFASQEFGGRVFRTRFNVVLPADFYPADNGKATLLLNAGYAPGLLTTNEVQVLINGRIVGARRLKKAYGESMRERGIEMSLKSLQPGFNTITLEIRTEAETDKDCNPLSLLEHSKRLVVSDQTAFTVPRISRVTHLPNMSATASTGYPLAAKAGPVALYLPKADFTSIGAAATFLARAAVAAGAPIQTQLTLTPPDVNTGNALIVGTVNDTPSELVNHFGIPKDGLPPSWTMKQAAPRAGARPPEAPQPGRNPRAAIEGAADSEAGITTASTPKDQKATKPSSAPDILDQMEDSIDQDSWLRGFANGLTAFLQRNVGYSADQLSFLNGGRAPFAVSKNARILVAQAPSPTGAGTSWHLLLAPDAQALQKDTSLLVAPSVWQQLAGKAITLDPLEADVAVWHTNSNYYFNLEDKSLQNITLFAAGWLSNNIQYYVLVILTICALFGVVTRLVLNRIGTRP